MSFLTSLFDLLFDIVEPCEHSSCDQGSHEFMDDWLADDEGMDWSSHDLGGSSSLDYNRIRMPAVNPATGLPMVGDEGGVDVAGNPYGFDNSQWHSSSDHGIDDRFHSDSFGCDSGLDEWSRGGFQDDSFGSGSGGGFDDW